MLPQRVFEGTCIAHGSELREDDTLTVLGEESASVATDEMEGRNHLKDEKFDIYPGLSSEDRFLTNNLLVAYSKMFVSSQDPLREIDSFPHRIDTGDHLPLHRPPFRVSLKERVVIQEQVDKMIQQDVAEPSTSP